MSQLFACKQITMPVRAEHEKSDAFSEVERVYYIFNDLCKPIHLWYEKTPIYKLSRSKAPETQQICHYRYERKTSELSLLYDTSVYFSSHNSFVNLGSLAKVSVPVGSIIPRANYALSRSCVLLWLRSFNSRQLQLHSKILTFIHPTCNYLSPFLLNVTPVETEPHIPFLRREMLAW